MNFSLQRHIRTHTATGDNLINVMYVAIFIFSSPDPVGYCHHLASVVRL